MSRIALFRAAFGEKEKTAVEHEGLTASLWRYSTGIEAVRLQNERGSLTVLPYLGQMVWGARFDGVDLTMRSIFREPRPARTIAETYGCLAFHSGILRNGVPGPQDDHAAHGEMPCAPMDEAALEIGTDGEGPFIRLTGSYEYAMGFGAHYLARPAVTLRAGSALFDFAMEVENLSAAPMELMYMAHVNFAWEDGGEIVQEAPFDRSHTRVRTAVPAHVTPNPAYLAFIEELAEDPSASRVLTQAERYDPEQVFYVEGLATDADGHTRAMLRRRDGGAFFMRYRPARFPKTVRWLLAGGDQSVAAFALPSTCEPEGYTAEKAKGNVRVLEGGGQASFSVRLGHLDAGEAEEQSARIAAIAKG